MSPTDKPTYDASWISQAATPDTTWQVIAKAFAPYVGPNVIKGTGMYALHGLADDNPARVVDSIFDALREHGLLSYRTDI